MTKSKQSKSDFKDRKINFLSKTVSVLSIICSLLFVSTSLLIFDKYTRDINFNFTPEAEVISLIQKNSINQLPEENKLDKWQMKGVVASLEDPYSQYFLKSELESFEDNLNERYEGVGIRFNFENQEVVAEEVIEGSPAMLEGVESGDKLLKVDDEFVFRMETDEIVENIRGEEGTEVKLTMEREGQEIDFLITRAKITTEMVELDFYENDVAILTVNSFGESLDLEMEEQILKIREKAEIDKIIIDLRGNTGGLLSQASEMVSYFVPEGEIVAIEKGNDFREEVRTNKKNINLFGYKTVILTDGYTASASEIFAEAVRYHADAKIVGSPTFGKGRVQKIFDLQNGDAIKLTVAVWLTPEEKDINESGVKPDFKLNSKVALDKVKESYNWEKGELELGG